MANVNKISDAELFGMSGFAFVSGKKDSIYKDEIFVGLNQDEKKKRRTKIRRNRDKFISEFETATTNERKIEIAKKWTEWAEKIYKDINCLFDANTSDDQVVEITNFQAGVKTFLAKENKGK